MDELQRIAELLRPLWPGVVMVATPETPQDTPFPALLFRAAWAALWPDVAALLLLGAMALACGAGGMWWLTGGVR